ncbi:MAG: HAD family hydrolase [Limnochordia bacterium]
MIKNVVFDLGRVLINFQPEAYLQRLFPGHTEIGFLRSAIFGSPEWLMLDRGVIDQAEAEIRLINQHPQFKKEIQAAFADWFSMLTPIEENAALLPELKGKGCGLYVISNFHADSFAYINGRYSWFKLFDGMIISCEHQVLKPEPRIYSLLLERWGLLAKECLFIDDVSANVEGARRMGMEAILYESHEQLLKELQSRLK